MISSRPMCRVACAALLAAAAVACSGGGKPPAAPTGDILAYVNKQAIRVADFEKRFARETAGRNRPTDPLSLLNTKLAVLNRIVDTVLVAQEAGKRGVAVTDADVEAAVRAVQADYPPDAFQRMLADRGLDLAAWTAQLRESLLYQAAREKLVAPTIQVSEDEMRRLYEARPREFERPAQVHAFQVVVATEAEAKTVRERLAQGADFGVLAQEVSIAPERAQGGDLGWFGPGQMPSEFDRVVFDLPVGTLSGVVKTPYGFHVFKVVERREARRGSFEEVRPVIEASVRDARLERATAAWIAGLREKADIAINETLLGK